MSKHILITSTDLMMVQFLIPHVKHLAEEGYQITLACSDVGGRFIEMRTIAEPFCKKIYKVDLQRSPLSLENHRGYKQLKGIINNESFDIIWTNEPVMGVATRLAARSARKKGTKVLYMVHGFHFFKNGPKLNWLLFYPIERALASYTDVICTVNTEDYRQASGFNIEHVEYIHGIGINTDRLSPNSDRKSIRKELGLYSDDLVVLSIGELNKNKNQKVIIKALKELQNPKIHYLICGKGKNETMLRQLVERLGLLDNVHFLGYRRDVVDICAEADIYAMPSFREGLPVSSLEAMYCGLPLVTSNIRGLTDVNKANLNGFLCAPNDCKAFARAIKKLSDDSNLRKTLGDKNRCDVIPYTIDNSLQEVENLFSAL